MRDVLLVALGTLLVHAQVQPHGNTQAGRVLTRVPSDNAGTPSGRQALLNFSGVVESLDSGKLVLAMADGRRLEFTCARETRYRRGKKTVKRQSLSAGVPAAITGWQNDHYQLFAKRVDVAGDRTRQAAPPPPAPARTDPRIEKARRVAQEFTASLASYVVDRVTTRHVGNYARSNWRLLDVVSAEVTYENGKEAYRRVRLNDKPVDGAMEQMSGLVTQGEFGNTLGALFSRESGAEFTAAENIRFQGRPAWRYEFTVRQPQSQWRTKVGSHSVQLAYKGSIWLDQATLRTLHIETQGQEIPVGYPMAAVEWAVSYASVRIGGREFLLPSHAESLACWRDTLQCHRNTTEFRNYHRFIGESRILAVDAADEPPAKPR